MQLEIRGVSKTYPNGVHALKNVTLSIAPGMCGLLGPNGAGKSTLMRTIATLPSVLQIPRFARDDRRRGARDDNPRWSELP